jgi:phenylalanyl-tRNA synthetase beta chain
MQGPKTVLGTFGEIHPQVLKELDVEGPVVGFELYLDHLPLLKETTRKKPLRLSSLQPIYRDFAFIVAQEIAAEKVLQAAQKVDRHLITEIAIFDVYQGPGIPEGKKSLAFTVTFEPYDKTLTDDEINHLMDQVIIAVGQETGGELRT